MHNNPLKKAAGSTSWQSLLAVRPPRETSKEKSETAKWLVRVVPTVSPAEQNAIWTVLWSEYPAQCRVLLRGYVQLYAPAYRAVLRANGTAVPPTPVAGAVDLPRHLLSALVHSGSGSDSDYLSARN